MRFKDIHRQFFNAVDGAFSVVTDREIFDSQITVTGEEAKLLTEYFERAGEPILIGNVSSCREKAMKQFRLYPGGESVGLNLVFPKPTKPELRLYIASRRGYKPRQGSVWFVYEGIDHKIWIGSMGMDEWSTMNLGRIEVRIHPETTRLSQVHSGLYEEDGVVYLDVIATKIRTHSFKA